MTSTLRRAAAFAVVATLALGAPLLGAAAVAPFLLVAAGAAATTSGPVFELFARPGDYQEGRLYGLLSFALAAAGLAVLPTLVDFPVGVFVAAVLLVGWGNLAAVATRRLGRADILTTAAFTCGGAGAAAVGLVAAPRIAAASLVADVPALAVETGVPVAPPKVVFLAASGALFAGLLRAVFPGHEDPLMLVAGAMALWLLHYLPVEVSWQGIALALAVTVGFGYVSWALDTASITGMLTGILLGLVTVVLGGYDWFLVMLAFFGIGGLSTKFRYEEKLDRGVAEPDGGARGTANVLGNSLPGLVAVVLFAASVHSLLPVSADVFQYAFAGSMATALGDTLSSEIGGLYDQPRLVTTFQRVEPGTDGAVTWQGELAGLAGSAVIAGLAVALFSLSAVGGVVVVAGGVAGMTADSLLGATVEGGYLGNQSVNFLATGTGAAVGGALALLL
ncbi:MAG: TIGR00297 family protein [Halobacteriaceae archaeon]